MMLAVPEDQTRILCDGMPPRYVPACIQGHASKAQAHKMMMRTIRDKVLKKPQSAELGWRSNLGQQPHNQSGNNDKGPLFLNNLYITEPDWGSHKWKTCFRNGNVT